MKIISKLIATAAALALIQSVSAIGAAAESEWQTAVSDSFSEGAALEYTTYDTSDTAEVEVTNGCPNDDASEWNVSGVQYTGYYMGQQYLGYQNSGIKANITKYIRNGDRLRVSFEYRSGYMGISPFIEVKYAGGGTKSYPLGDSSNSETWRAYASAETEPVYFGESDSVSLVIMNQTGFWHLRSLLIERYGEKTYAGFLSSVSISGLNDGRLPSSGSVLITGRAAGEATLYSAVYSGARLSEVKKRDVSGGFELSMNCSGADELKLFAWDGMAPRADAVTVNSDGTGSYSIPSAAKTLKERYSDSFLVGSIYDTRNLYGADKDILLKHFNVFTPENILKPDHLAPYEGYYNWSDADRMMDFAEENGLEVIGHTLVWHQQTPDWLTEGTKDEVYKKMENYIKTVVGRYKGRIKGWDVVNEALRDNIDKEPPSWSYYIRKNSETSGSKWFRALNDSEYIYKAFLFAHEADPDAELYYNDYNLDAPYKREAVALLVKHVNDKYKTENNTDENLIDAIGMQSHYNLGTNVDEVRASIARFREIGVKVNISELDICLTELEDNGSGDTSSDVTLTPSQEMRQAVKYADLMSVYKSNADIIDRVTFWGYSDALSWRSAQFPLIFNGDLSPKKSYYAVMTPELYR